MTEAELIAKQQLQIEAMRELLSQCVDSFARIHGVIYSIGGPLNDNKLQYTTAQMRDFKRIADECLEIEIP